MTDRGGRPRVVVTGMGSISACGLGVDALWTAARDGESGVGPVMLPRDLGHRVKIAAQVRGFEAEAHLPAAVIGQTDRFSHFALVAAAEAMHQARLPKEARLGERTAIVMGSGFGGATTM